MGRIGIRTFTEKTNKKNKPKFQEKEIPIQHERVLVFDTETSSDKFQNLKFGSSIIGENGKVIYQLLFYDSKTLTKKEIVELEEYSEKFDIDLYSLEDFIEEVFYPELLKMKSLCIGFNLPFDLSRLANHWSEARGNQKGWFTFQLSENKLSPWIKIKHLDSDKSFIQFSKPRFKGKIINLHKGYFLDLKTLASIFSDNKKITLKEAGKFFKCSIQKSEVKEHGKINEDYVGYNLSDTLATFDLYLNLLKHYQIYNINAPITKIFSSATLGKYALRQMGISPLSRISSQTKGMLMASYYGGRCELRVRKTPTEVAVLDFLSMYPSLTIIMGLWDYMTAKKIIEKDVTDVTKDFLKQITLESLTSKELWKNFNVLIELEPDEDILPIRSNYLDKSLIYNVGINYFKHEDTFYYTIPDVISSILLTGKVPRIKKAIRFIPEGKQDSLKETEILGIKVNPKTDNFIKILIEKRQEFKEKRDSYNNGNDYEYYDGIQKALKILANSMTYGIFIEVNPQDKKSELIVYSKETFITNQKLEEEGAFFNPLIAVMQVAGARLLLTMAESFLIKNGYEPVYMDTDSCFIPHEIAEKLRDFFKTLNPYGFNSDFFQIEKGKERLLFYGISSKRYVLYKIINGKIEIIDYKLHGLGHLLNPYERGINWQKKIWEDILNLHYGNITEKEIIEKYSQFYALSKLTISTPSLLKRFKLYNKNKPTPKQIKPFNFILIGQGNSEVKPIASFNKNFQSVIYEKFIDYKSGRILKGQEYWRPLSEIIFNYIDHPESKFDNGDKSGKLSRKHIAQGEIRFIGKEVRNLEEQFLDVQNPIEYGDEGEIRKVILEMSNKEAKEKGVSRPTLWKIKRKIREGKKVNLKTKSVKILIS